MRLLVNTDGGVRTGGVKGPTGGKTGPAAAGWVVRSDDGEVILTKGGLHIGEATVNEAEYAAVFLGLSEAAKQGATSVHVLSDSQLIVNQLKGAWAIRQAHLRECWIEVKEVEAEFEQVTYEWIPREQNSIADGLTEDVLGVR